MKKVKWLMPDALAAIVHLVQEAIDAVVAHRFDAEPGLVPAAAERRRFAVRERLHGADVPARRGQVAALDERPDQLARYRSHGGGQVEPRCGIALAPHQRQNGLPLPFRLQLG